MPLRDHFRGWLPRRMGWSSFACAWATYTAFGLNEILPDDFRASPDVRAGTETLHDGPHWTPGRAPLAFPFELSGASAELLVHGSRDGEYLAAAIEFVCPNDTATAGARQAFVARCEAYLRRGAGLVVVNLVTSGAANLQDDLAARLCPGWSGQVEPLCCTAYRPVQEGDAGRLEVWLEPLALGSPLPTMPLWLQYASCVPVHLEATYEETFRKMRLPTEEPR